MVIYDSIANSIQKVPIKGPRWFTVTVGEEPSRGLMLPESNTTALIITRMYVRIKTSRVQADLDAAQAMRDAYVGQGHVATVEIEEDARTLVQNAAKAAVAASQGEGPVADYAALVEVHEPGTKEGVARRLAAYRKAAL
jgi:hypothetical protein